MKARKSKYLDFIELEPKPKTKVFKCINKVSLDELGFIKWYPPFRKYAYFSNGNIVYDRNCLEDITNFIDELSKSD